MTVEDDVGDEDTVGTPTLMVLEWRAAGRMGVGFRVDAAVTDSFADATSLNTGGGDSS